MAEHRDALGFEFAVAAQPADRLQRLNEVKPDIVHFAGSAARVAGRVPFHRPKSAFSCKNGTGVGAKPPTGSG
jgi:hypothetical protein